MRQKKVKHIHRQFFENAGVVTKVKPVLLDSKRVFLEIGSGKGKFITDMAKDHPHDLFVAMEININVCYRILQKKEAMNLDNLIIILGDATNLLDYISDSQIDGIFLNFSDPWPKKKHHKRRLTSPIFLEKYLVILKHDGFIQFRTDHADFFYDSIEYMTPHMHIKKINNHVDPSDYMTEYEMKKRVTGTIYQLDAEVKKDA
ncbi:MAG: tRNA (guanosine(46)-N7)-methyltransferase TrmB [Acholeplasmataceae bacterium]|nr:tRNA (guanosine(46)-N7)-methyltransferase TrmB [Acholeplasmataceae bacterium]